MTRAELGGALLKAVSRSFYLSIKVLPKAVREPIGLAYLLARASDTIADTADAPVETRLQALEFFAGCIARADAQPLPWNLHPPTPVERVLLERIPEALAWLAALEPADRADLQWVLAIIIRGQHDDLTRPWPVQTDAELDDYTYRVAGCVGEFWTRICHRHLPRFSRLPLAELSELGVRFGKGLQLVNILRDAPEDARAGRRYLPSAEPGEFARWLSIARSHLEAASRYIGAIRPWRVRYACLLPAQLGWKTLARLSASPSPAGAKKIKVPRAEVYALMLRALPAAFCERARRSLEKDSHSTLAQTNRVP